MSSSPADRRTVAVCLKWVATAPEIDPLTGDVAVDHRFSGLSAADLAALEWGLRIAEKFDLHVLALSVGPASADEGLRQALAHGAAEVIRIDGDDDRFPSRAVASLLAGTCRSAAVVLCGDHSLDRGSGSVPAFLAAELGFGQALGCVGLELDGEPHGEPDGEPANPESGSGSGRPLGSPAWSITAERRLDQGRREQLRLTGPTVVSFEGGIELRRAPLAATVKATTTPIPVTAAAPANLTSAASVTGTGPYRPRPKASTSPTGSTLDRIRQLTGVGRERPTAKQLELNPAEAAEVALEQLKNWGYLDAAEPTDVDPGTGSGHR